MFIQNLLWDIPRCNIYATIMPDLLHQIKKGVWSHLLNWFQSLLQEIYEVRKVNEYLDEIDKRFALVPCFRGIKSFPKGIRGMEQITAGEYAHIMKVCLETILLNNGYPGFVAYHFYCSFLPDIPSMRSRIYYCSERDARLYSNPVVHKLV